MVLGIIYNINVNCCKYQHFFAVFFDNLNVVIVNIIRQINECLSSEFWECQHFFAVFYLPIFIHFCFVMMLFVMVNT